MSLTFIVAVKVLLLSFVANGSPILAARLFGKRWSTPVDGGLRFFDGRPLLGASKTIRGILFSTGCCALVAPLLGYSWQLGLSFGAASMTGDAISSFIKRRLGTPPSGRSIGLDQLPEILLPLLVCAVPLGLDWFSIGVLAIVFWVGSLLLSRIGYALGLKKRPY